MKNNKLHNIKNSGFKTPENYFSNLEDKVMLQVLLEEKIDRTAFKTPDNYFESLDNRIISQVSKKSETKIISLPTKRKIIALTGVAAAIILLFNLNLFNNEFSFSSIDNETLENYVSNQEFEEFDLETVIIKDIDISSFIKEESISDASLENYLYNVSELEDFISE